MKLVPEVQSVVHPAARDESSGRAQARYASYLAFNFGASIATIFLGKAQLHVTSASRQPGLLGRTLSRLQAALCTRDESPSRAGPDGRLRCGRDAWTKILRRSTPSS